MDGKKVFQIQINGVNESINAVTALNKQLEALESRIKQLEKNNVKINAGGGGSSKSSSSSLSEEEKIAKQIEQIDAKREAYSKEIYQNYLAAKDVLKETVEDQKQIAAAERLQANNYSNTMAGMKQQLADIKSVMQTVDLGDTDTFNKMTKDANELNEKLKEIEKSYGQFGRDVGNYANGVAEGLQKVKINVGGTVREFDNAKQASRTLGNELKTMAVNGQQGTKAFKELQQVVMELESNINDAKKPMDNLMDSMQSVMAIANLGQGIRGLFGIDDAEIQKTIKNLVALQNILKGIETINEQINTKQGIGAWIAPFNAGVDKATAKLLTFNTALLGTGKASKVAAAGINLFSKALKVAFSAGILIAVDLLVEKLMDLVENFKKVDKAAEATKETQEEVAKAYAEGSAKLQKYQTIVNNFNGTKAQEKKLVEELNRELGEGLGTYKSLAEWQDTLVKKGAAYIEMLKLQAKAQASFNLYVKALEDEQKKKEMSTEDYANWLNELADFVWTGWGDKLRNRARVEGIQEAKAYREGIEEQWLADQKELQKFMETHSVGVNATQATTEKNNSKKTEKATKESQETLNQLVIRLMQDGLNKKLRQLDEEERQTINKLKQNSKTTEEELRRISEAYAALRIKEIDEYLKNLDERIKESANNIKSIEFDINTSKIKNAIDSLKNMKEEESKALDMSSDSFQSLTSSRDLRKEGIDVDDQLNNSFKMRYQITSRYYDSLIQLLISYQNDEKALREEDIKEQERQFKESEGNRYSIQMSGLTKTKKDIEEGLQAIVDKYGEKTKEGAIVVEESNKKISEETLQSYRDLETKLIEIDAQIETAKKQHKDKLEEISKSSNNAIKKNEIDNEKEISASRENYYNLQISNFREFLSKMNDEINENPVMNKTWGVVDVKKTKKNYQEIINASKTALQAIKSEKEKIGNDPLLSRKAKEATIKQLEDLERSIEQGMTVTVQASQNLTRDYLESLEAYLQAAFQVLNSALDAMWDAFDRAFDKEQEQLDRENDALQEALDKQRDMIRDHSNEINSIEDELATARGDRRQHLIDQLNAEMELQREAAKEQKRLDREEQKNKEQMQKKQDALDEKRRKAEYARNIAQAIVNGAMAVTYAAINKWPIPAVPMMKLAAATSAAQLAIVLANKPYAKGGQLDGGVAQGKRHSEGGIPVLGGRASIEGGEFITNRQTTAKNVDLLEYINAKHRKLDIDDFIEFYSGGTVKKNIQSVRTKFADGGQIPTLRNDIAINDRLITAMEDYSNRPTIVSVVDIIDRTQAVNDVKVMAGLEV